MKFLALILKNLRRSKARTVITVLAVVLLVATFSMVTTVLRGLTSITSEKSRDVKIILTERYRIPSRFDRRHVEQIVMPGSTLHSQLRQIPGFDAARYTIWHFVAFTLDPNMKDKDQVFLAIATLPEKIPLMTDELENLDPRLCTLLKDPPRSHNPNTGLLVGAQRLKKLNKKVGDVFLARSTSHREGGGARLPIEMQFEIVGTLPARSRWADSAIIDYEYLDRVLKDKHNEMDGQVNLAWLTVADQQSAGQVGAAIEQQIRDLKCETAATAFSRFLEPFKDLFWGIRFVLVPAIAVVMTVIVANAISITVRERTSEIAVLKVLGFQRRQVLGLVLGEGLVMGLLGGLLGGGGTHLVVNYGFGGLPLGDGRFFLSGHAWWWGLAIGAGTSLLGGILPAWSACTVKVSEVFARVA